MSELHLLANKERELFFREAATELNIPFAIIEKDFWVVWTLGQLFLIEELKTHLTFKGGTSLSKVYGLIERFSEDIDVSIEKQFLGFGSPEKDPDKAVSSKKQRAALEELSKTCTEYVQNDLLSALKKNIAKSLGTTEDWDLIPDEHDPQALIFEYPNITPRGNYIHQAVKIEMGARSEHWPVSEHQIESLAKKALKEKVNETKTNIRVLNAERTFWEKATLLHQYAHLPEGKQLPPRLSRHLYDFYQLLNSPVKNKALSDITLLDRVANHKKIYFASAWANYDQAKKGALKLMPPERILEQLKKDYDLMSSMFYGSPRPEWSEILKAITAFENQFNKS